MEIKLATPWLWLSMKKNDGKIDVIQTLLDDTESSIATRIRLAVREVTGTAAGGKTNISEPSIPFVP